MCEHVRCVYTHPCGERVRVWCTNTHAWGGPMYVWCTRTHMGVCMHVHVLCMACIHPYVGVHVFGGRTAQLSSPQSQ